SLPQAAREATFRITAPAQPGPVRARIAPVRTRPAIFVPMPAVGRRLLFALLTLLFPGLHAVHAQTTAADTLDQVDSQGRKQGWWRVVAPNTDRTGYPDGALVEEGRYQNGRRVGVWRRYWPNGQPMSEITYQMGRPRGPYVTYYRNGQVEERG